METQISRLLFAASYLVSWDIRMAGRLILLEHLLLCTLSTIFQLSMGSRLTLILPYQRLPEGLESLSTDEEAGTSHVQGIRAGHDFRASNVNVIQASKYFNCLLGKTQIKSICTVRAPNEDFQGRREILREIHLKFTETSRNGSTAYRLALVGYGGMGKSEIARKYAAEHYKSFYAGAVWLEAETEESLKQSFFNLAQELQLDPKKDESGCDIAKRVFSHAGKHMSSTLFIYDNADGLKTRNDAFGILEYLPQGIYDHPVMVLITSRTNDWGREIIHLPELTQVETIEFFRSRFGLSKEQLNEDQALKAQIDQLSECLQGYPLVLQLAVGNLNYVRNQHTGRLLQSELGSFVQLLKGTIAREVMDRPTCTNPEYPHTLRIVWEETMKKLRAEEFKEEGSHVLKALAYCNPDNTVVGDLKEAFGVTTFDRAMQPLQKLALVQIHEESWRGSRVSCVRIHRILQKLLRQEDEVGCGLRGLLVTGNISFTSNYMSSAGTLTLPRAIMGDDQAVLTFLKCFAVGLRLNRMVAESSNNAGRLQFGSTEEQQLRERGSSEVELILATVELIKIFETEKHVGKKYDTAVTYVERYPKEFITAEMAETWAAYCWASKPFACNLFKLKRLARTVYWYRFVVALIVLLIIGLAVWGELELKNLGFAVCASLGVLAALVIVGALIHYVIPPFFLCCYPKELNSIKVKLQNRLCLVFIVFSFVIWVVGDLVVLGLYALSKRRTPDIIGVAKNSTTMVFTHETK